MKIVNLLQFSSSPIIFFNSKIYWFIISFKHFKFATFVLLHNVVCYTYLFCDVVAFSDRQVQA